MALKTFPAFGGGGTAPSPGSDLNFPLMGPPGSPAAYGFTSGGGLRGTSAGGLALEAMGGDAVLVDPSGSVSLPFALAVDGAAQLSGGLTTTTISAASASLTGNASIGGSLGVAGSAQLDGDLSANKITARGALGAASVSSTGPIAGSSLSVTGKATLGSLEVKGVFQASSIASDGPFLFPTTSPNLPGLALFDETSTGVFGAAGGVLGFTVAGAVAGTFTSDKKLSMQGALAAPQADIALLAVTTLAVTGDTSLAKLTATDGTFSGNVGIAGNLQVDGAARLANLVIDQISTDHDLTVGGNAKVVGNLLVQGATTVGNLTATGPSQLTALIAMDAQLGGIKVPGGGGDYPPVLRLPRPNTTVTDDFSIVATSDGTVLLSKDFSAGGTGRFHGAVTLDSTLVAQATTLASAAITGALTVGAGASVTGALTASGRLTASSSTVGGSSFSAVRGSPAGKLSGAVGDQAIDLDSGTLYLKMSGAGTSNGWVPVPTQAASGAMFPLLARDSPDDRSPQYAFASDSRAGFGRRSDSTLFFSVGEDTLLEVQPNGNVFVPGGFDAGVFLQTEGTLFVASDSTLANVTAQQGLFQGLSTGPLSANHATLQSGEVAGNLGAASLAAGQVTVTGDVQVAGSVTAQGDVGGFRLLAGTSVVQGGSGSPEGTVTGNPGDIYLERDPAGSLWVKGGTASSSTTGWAKVSTSASGTTFPLVAPDGSLASPSYGFSQGQMGITALAAQTLAGITAGKAGWTLDGNQNMALAAGLTVAGASSLQALAATAVTAASLISSGALTVQGNSSLQALTAQAVQVSTLAASGAIQAASISSGSSVTASGPISGAAVSGSTIASGASTWRSLVSAPANTLGADGDITSLTQGTPSLLVRSAGTWRQVALTGDPAPVQFPLRGPSDSASAPNFAPAATSPSSGMFSPGANQLAFSTNGTQAAVADASQKWTFAGAIAAPQATVGQIQVNGPLTATGATSLGGTLQVSGAVTLASSLSSSSVTASGAISGASASISGLLTAQSASTTGDVTVGGNLTVNGVQNLNGINRSGSFQTGDGSIGAPAYAFTSEASLGWYKPSASTLAAAAGNANMVTLAGTLATFAGAVRVGGTNAGLTSPGTNQLALQTAGTTAVSINASGITTFAFQAQHVVGNASAPGIAFSGGTSGLYTGTAGTMPFVGVASGGVGVGAMGRYTTSGSGGASTVNQITVGDPSQAAVPFTSLSVGTLTPNGNVSGTGGAIYVVYNGGQGSAWLNEGTAGNTTTWNKILTTASPVSPTFPILGPAGTQAAPTFAVGVAGSGMYLGTYGGTSVNYTGITFAGANVCCFNRFTSSGTGGASTVWQLNLGDAVTSGGVLGAISVGTLSPNGNVGGNGGALHSVFNGGTQSFWVNEGTTNNSSAWSRVYTTGQAQLGSTNGSAAAPYYAFAVKNQGLYSDGNYPLISHLGAPAAAFISNFGGIAGYAGLLLGNPATTGIPYLFGVPAAAANAGNPVTNQVLANQAALMLNAAGAAGDQLWIHESSTNTNYAAWVRVLTESTANKSLLFQPVATPTLAAATGRVWLDSAFQWRASTGSLTPTAPPVLRQDIPAIVYGASQTLLRDNAGGTLVIQAAQQHTLPASATIDLVYRWQVEAAVTLTIKANTGQTIAVGNTVSAAAGTTSTSQIGSTIELFLRAGGTLWIARSVTGSWVTA